MFLIIEKKATRKWNKDNIGKEREIMSYLKGAYQIR
jgi:hypothetical protein